MLREFLWDLPALFLAGLAIFEWHIGTLPGFWAIVVCWLAVLFVLADMAFEAERRS